MPSFQEFAQKRQEQRAQAQQYQQPGAMQQRPQASSNAVQQPKLGNAPSKTGAPDYSKIAAGHMQPTGGGSAVNSSGRVVPGGPPPLWQQQQQMDGVSEGLRVQTAHEDRTQAMHLQEADRNRMMEFLKMTSQQPKTQQQIQQERDQGPAWWTPQGQSAPQFDPNSFKGVTTDPAQKAYWEYAMKEQQGIDDFFGGLQAGAPVSGSPGQVWVQNPAGEWGTMQAQGGLRPPQLPTEAPTYNPRQFSQWQQPNQGEFEQGGGDLLAYMLQNPESMSNENVLQMKAQGQDQATSMARQLQEAVMGDAAARGLSGGGMERGALNKIGTDMATQVLTNNRDTDLKKMVQDRLDQRNVLADTDNFLTGQMGRAGDSYMNKLRGETADDTSQQFAANFGQGQLGDFMNILMQQYGIENSNDQAGKTRDLQEKLGLGELGLGRERLGEDRRQFDMNYPLNAAQILGNLGLGYGNLDLNNRQFASDTAYRDKNAFLTWLFGNR